MHELKTKCLRHLSLGAAGIQNEYACGAGQPWSTVYGARQNSESNRQVLVKANGDKQHVPTRRYYLGSTSHHRQKCKCRECGGTGSAGTTAKEATARAVVAPPSVSTATRNKSKICGGTSALSSASTTATEVYAGPAAAPPSRERGQFTNRTARLRKEKTSEANQHRTKVHDHYNLQR